MHATHDTVLYRAIRPPERLTTQLTVAGVERRKPGAYMVTRLDTVDAAGKPVCTSWYGAIYRGVEVKGPDAPAKLPMAPPEPVVEEGEPLWECEVDVPAGMAHIYTECARIFNPIHTDAAVARAAGLPEIILHGTATLALAVSRVIESEAGKRSCKNRKSRGAFRRDGDDALDADSARPRARRCGCVLRSVERRRAIGDSRWDDRAARVARRDSFGDLFLSEERSTKAAQRCRRERCDPGSCTYTDSVNRAPWQWTSVHESQ